MPATGVAISQVNSAVIDPYVVAGLEVQEVASPEIVHVKVPDGAPDPLCPVTNAVTVKGCPTVGFEGL